ncbi:MAG: hypothetical protein ABSH28_05425 [Acidobacteriota bacterium]|jgi:hypothetical protein
MSRNESQTCRELIEPALRQAGWSWDRHVLIGTGRVYLVGESMAWEASEMQSGFVQQTSALSQAVLVRAFAEEL